MVIESLKGKNGKYKRYLGSPLRYAGGKSLAVGMITELMPSNISKVVSPFIGGGSVEVALAKELGVEVVGYDVFDMLVNYWQHQATKGEEMYQILKDLKPTKEEYYRIKGILKEHWTKENGYDGKLDPLIAAVYYYYNMQLSYGPEFLGWFSSIYDNEKKYTKTIEKVRDFNVPNLKVYNKPFEESIVENNGEFLYLDPPYFLDGDSKVFKGIYPNGNFPIFHKGFDHQLLSDLLKSHKGGFILSYNDCEWVRETYKDFKIIDAHWQYTYGQGETRISNGRTNREYDNNHIKSSSEVLIIS
jgi:DNA adenine methylase